MASRPVYSKRIIKANDMLGFAGPILNLPLDATITYVVRSIYLFIPSGALTSLLGNFGAADYGDLEPAVVNFLRYVNEDNVLNYSTWQWEGRIVVNPGQALWIEDGSSGGAVNLVMHGYELTEP